MAAKKALGRGLDVLLDELDLEEQQTGSIEQVSLYDIDTNPDQPRKTFDEEKLNELAASIKRHGVVQPLIVKQNGTRYTIIAGERRFRAARIAGLSTVPVLVSDMDENAIMEVALVENIQRENLNPIEEAAAIRLLMEQHDLTQEEVSARIGKSRPAIANALRLLSLDKPVAEMIKTGKLSAGHGKMLAGIADAAQQRALAEKAVEKDWSVRRLENELQFASWEKKPKVKQEYSPEFRAAIRAMRNKLKTKVSVEGTEEKGRIVISYFSPDDLETIYQAIVGDGE
ncbi:MAG: ParB/RepB/Spo0J family partition protein [Clostridia bacterium]|nr:ParB/RepB/Spo0J family partition protein [Clostridia bacterium]MBQ9189349.1 ParB/RepB/Spo0J family partition protein [Clostridia bacterium]